MNDASTSKHPAVSPRPAAESVDGSLAGRPRYTPELVEQLLTQPDPPPGAATAAAKVAGLFASVALTATADWFDALSSSAEEDARAAFDRIVAHFHPALWEVAAAGPVDTVMASVWETVWRTRTTWPPGGAGLESLLRKFEETRRTVTAATAHPPGGRPMTATSIAADSPLPAAPPPPPVPPPTTDDDMLPWCGT